jgi:hypothetical protein
VEGLYNNKACMCTFRVVEKIAPTSFGEMQVHECAASREAPMNVPKNMISRALVTTVELSA